MELVLGMEIKSILKAPQNETLGQGPMTKRLILINSIKRLKV
jgi:hypothetical protein